MFKKEEEKKKGSATGISDQDKKRVAENGSCSFFSEDESNNKLACVPSLSGNADGPTWDRPSSKGYFSSSVESNKK